MKVKMNRPEWTFGTEFLFFKEDRDNYISFVVEPINLILKRVERGQRIEQPSLVLHDSIEETEFIQSFLDEAWKLGFRPSETIKTEKELNSILESVRYHLEDMRKLVFEGILFRKEGDPIPFKFVD